MENPSQVAEKDSGAEVKHVPGVWTLGKLIVHESGIVDLSLEHTSLDEPIHVWALSRDEFQHTDPDTLARQVPQGLRRQYDIDLFDLAKALAVKQRECEKPWLALVKGAKLRLTGERPVLVDELAPKVPDPQPYGTEDELFEDTCDFLKANVIFAESEVYTVVSSWVLLSWRIEDTNVAPYLYVTAPRGHGKTRLLETLNQVVRRPLVASYATRTGAIRALDGTNAVLLLDEAEHYVNPHERQNSDLAAILNAGYRRGAKGDHGCRCYRGVAGWNEALSQEAHRPRHVLSESHRKQTRHLRHLGGSVGSRSSCRNMDATWGR